MKKFYFILGLLIFVIFCQKNTKSFEYPEILAQSLFKDLQNITQYEDLKKIKDVYFPDEREVMELMTVYGGHGDVNEIMNEWMEEIESGLEEWTYEILGSNDYEKLVRERQRKLNDQLRKKIEEEKWDIYEQFGAERYNKESTRKIYSDPELAKKIDESMKSLHEKIKEWEKENKIQEMNILLEQFHQKFNRAKYVGFERGESRTRKSNHIRIGRSRIKVLIDGEEYHLDIDNMDKIFDSYKITDWD